MQTRVMSLGETLVQELGLDPGCDTLSRWMAHYVAEKMETAKNATGDEKHEAERECFETILKLWDHRSSLPDGSRPLENFEPIYQTLARLGPEESENFFYRYGETRPDAVGEPSDKPDEVEKWLDTAEKIDDAASVLLEYVFHQAAAAAKDEKTEDWLENEIAFSGTHHRHLIVRLLKPYSDEKDGEGEESCVSEKELNARIQALDEFVEDSRSVRSALANERDKPAQREGEAD